MEIVYAAEKTSIAEMLSRVVDGDVRPDDIDVQENPNETGSFYIGHDFERFVMFPDGTIEARNLSLLSEQTDA